MLSAITRWLFKVWGWRVVGPVPTVPKAIWVETPHTTNWDFLVGLGVRPTIHIWIQYFAKSSLFAWYSGWLFRVTGGIPVYRDKAHNLVDAMVHAFDQNERIHICIAPEGTRGNVDKLKTGFYYIAVKANVPLILVGFDWPRKLVILSEPLYLTGDYPTDMIPFYEFFSQVHGPKKNWFKQWEKTRVIES
ncbi:1-acyl-sn-glycerol-3-phosphate acyltransferase [Spirosoma sp. BT702]|uniref:1-acyl-sn-glycerol-3-phosphate acyltransferase n=1 Tax=Spirosoma profusum TaxID=2771354 RepID=A0A927AVC1_9BACT|nr:1-acyl-sn-glycerol-3-phosphate acyltransferase [Spirosoma profusum]MBD2705064.1 1-acyl-sn-glycerol-3-phosphate acyltransferase [Spirosoma profusum]